MSRVSSVSLPPLSPETAERVDQVLTLLDEYSAKLGTALAQYEAQRQRMVAVLAGAMMSLSLVGLILVQVAELNPGYEVRISKGVYYTLPGLAGFALYVGNEWLRLRRGAAYLWAIAVRLDPVLSLAISTHEELSLDPFRQHRINLKLTEARLWTERVEQLRGREVRHAPGWYPVNARPDPRQLV